MTNVLQKPGHASGTDNSLDQIKKLLDRFETDHPGSQCELYRRNPAAIRIRITSDHFDGQSRGERHDFVANYLMRLGGDEVSDVSMILCRTPEEPKSQMDDAFDSPGPSYF